MIRKTLATSWEMVNPSTWIFKLRQGVRFHNRPPVNGREMTAEDVKYSYELLKDKTAYATRAALVKAVHVIDKYTVKFELAMPDPKFYLNVVDSLSPVIVPRGKDLSTNQTRSAPVTSAMTLASSTARIGPRL